ncbi:G-type lectin S-receptor-like serine/threonine-protein kinase SD1-1 [Artemisia annua]|uniref:G-type lectin S-receptor-like serine/threonine-protein kinase SD1-1 n=1 Tax=Artemisia annua TaxID=35608 RepID=A0A2U1MJW2_ARTAN|nr:G-type lectin S-receptor-like serine/threonine-protein kinase SD1-1 [Artemisia annua]
MRVIEVWLLCVQQSPEDRPSMSLVVLALSNEGALPTPKEPTFFIENNYLVLISIQAAIQQVQPIVGFSLRGPNGDSPFEKICNGSTHEVTGLSNVMATMSRAAGKGFGQAYELQQKRVSIGLYINGSIRQMFDDNRCIGSNFLRFPGSLNNQTSIMLIPNEDESELNESRSQKAKGKEKEITSSLSSKRKKDGGFLDNENVTKRSSIVTQHIDHDAADKQATMREIKLEILGKLRYKIEATGRVFVSM